MSDTEAMSRALRDLRASPIPTKTITLDKNGANVLLDMLERVPKDPPAEIIHVFHVVEDGQWVRSYRQLADDPDGVGDEPPVSEFEEFMVRTDEAHRLTDVRPPRTGRYDVTHPPMTQTRRESDYADKIAAAKAFAANASRKPWTWGSVGERDSGWLPAAAGATDVYVEGMDEDAGWTVAQDGAGVVITAADGWSIYIAAEVARFIGRLVAPPTSPESRREIELGRAMRTDLRQMVGARGSDGVLLDDRALIEKVRAMIVSAPPQSVNGSMLMNVAKALDLEPNRYTWRQMIDMIRDLRTENEHADVTYLNKLREWIERTRRDARADKVRAGLRPDDAIERAMMETQTKLAEITGVKPVWHGPEIEDYELVSL